MYKRQHCRWLQAEVSRVTTRTRCAYYISILRRAIWPSDEGGSTNAAEAGSNGLSSDQRLNAARSRACDALVEFFPSKCRTVIIIIIIIIYGTMFMVLSS